MKTGAMYEHSMCFLPITGTTATTKTASAVNACSCLFPIGHTANFVGMERSALHRKLKGLGIKEFN